MEVAQKKANAFGLYDMLGNVEELTYTTNLNYDIVESNKTSNTPQDALYTIVHGKSYKTMAMGCKELWWDVNIYNDREYCNAQRENLGFRIVRSITE